MQPVAFENKIEKKTSISFESQITGPKLLRGSVKVGNASSATDFLQNELFAEHHFLVIQPVPGEQFQTKTGGTLLPNFQLQVKIVHGIGMKIDTLASSQNIHFTNLRLTTRLTQIIGSPFIENGFEKMVAKYFRSLKYK